MSQYITIFDLKINVGHCNLYFMVQSYDPMSDFKIFVGHCDIYFMVH